MAVPAIGHSRRILAAIRAAQHDGASAKRVSRLVRAWAEGVSSELNYTDSYLYIAFSKRRSDIESKGTLRGHQKPNLNRMIIQGGIQMSVLGRISLVALLVASMLVVSIPQAWSADSIKIGFMAPYVGVYTKPGMDMDNGFRLYLDEVGWKAGGRKIEVIKSDTEGKPPLGPTKVRELVEKDKVNLLAGIVHSGVAYSIRDYISEKKMPLILTNVGAPKLTGEKKSPYIFRVSFANGQQDLAGGCTRTISWG